MRLKDVVRINRTSLPETTDPNYSFRYIDISAVDGLGNVTVPESVTTFSAAPSRARRLGPSGATVVSTVRTYLRAIGRVPAVNDSLVFSTGFAVLEAGPRVDAGYLFYLCRSEPFVQDVVARSVGVSYPAINPSDLGSFRMDLPALEEQRRIANFLDDQVERFRRLMAALASAEALASESRVAIMNRAWEAEAPTVRLGYYLALATSGSRSWSDHVRDEGAIFFRSANLRRDGIRPNLSHLVRVQPPLRASAEASRARIRPGDVLVGITGANTGWVSLAEGSLSDAYVSQHVCLIRPVPEISSRWLAYVMSSSRVQQELLASQYGGTKTQLSLPDIRNIRVPKYPTSVQRALAQQASAQLSALERQRELRGRQRTLLAERLAALITKAVTSQLDVATARGVDA
ncbi:restriction endonuclease subunit S [Micromonospora sp. NPDC049580]|uniref:restriction endonuclease subunit S n=1 Tax=Micromonospora sp. NPDC049580 TaxID=3154832 RepID=UPI003444284E